MKTQVLASHAVQTDDTPVAVLDPELAHARRKFYEAQSSDLMRSMILLAYIRLLYDVERQAREQNLDAEARRALRQAKARPILADIHTYLENEQRKVLPQSPIAEAVAYTLNNWQFGNESPNPFYGTLTVLFGSLISAFFPC